MKKGRNNWATPQALFDLLNAEFHFNLDVCAEAGNAKCECYFDKENDGLSAPWYDPSCRTNACFMNPPYKDEQGRNCVYKWAEKAFWEAHRGAIVVGLMKLDPTTKWWYDFVLSAAECRILLGARLKFDDGKGAAEFPCAVVVWRKHVGPLYTWYWDWRMDLPGAVVQPDLKVVGGRR